MNKKSILEEALLEANQLEEAVKNNAKEILASTMKEEIEELVKESLTEMDDEDEDSLEMDDMEDLEGGEDEVEDVDIEDVEDVLPDSSEEGLADVASMLPLDLTSASDEEVLTVFKAMGEDDGVIVTQDDETISIDDENTGAQYKIDLAEEDMSTWGGNKGDESKSHRDYETNERAHYGGNKGDESKSRPDYETNEMYGGNKGDESRSKRDYMEGTYGGNKGDESRSHRDYETNEGTYGGNKGDESRSHRDYETNEMYGGNKGDESKSRRDYETNEMYGGNKGDESRSRRDYETNEMYGGNKGDESRSHRDYMGEMDTEEPVYEIELDEDFAETGVMGVDAPESEKGEKGRDYETHDMFEDDDLTGEKEMKETSRLKSGQKTFPKMAGQHWGKNDLKESRRRAPRTSMRQLKESYKNVVKDLDIKNNHLNALKEENARFKQKNQEYKKALGLFKEKINEVAVFNANLAYATKLFTENTTTKKEKINIIRRFDDVSTLKESKTLYMTINREFKGKGKVVSESVKAKITKSPSKGSSSKLLESKAYVNPQISRMKEIMSKL